MIITISIIVALLFFIFFNIWINKKKSGNKEMTKVSKLIRKGSITFLFTEYKILSIFIVVISAIIAFFNYALALCFFLGSVFSLIIGNIGMRSATRANVLTAEACKKDLSSGMRVAFFSGLNASITAMFLGLFSIIGLYYYFGNPQILYGFAFGASLVALFMRVGGGIFTKSADISADMIGKIEKNLPEDDPRNPAVVADLVGDNVGDVAGMSSDLFESYIASIVAAMVIISVLGLDILVPLKLVSIGIISCLASMIFMRGKNIYRSVLGGFFFSAVSIAILSYFILNSYFYPILFGLVGGLVIGFDVFYYTSSRYRPTLKIASSAEDGAALSVLSGLSNGLYSTLIPILVISAIMILSFNMLGILGIVISAVSMLSILGVVLASTIYGSITDNASGIAEFSRVKKAKINASKLDELGNTTAAIGKGFTISSAALTVLSLLASFILLANIEIIDILKVENMAALFIGGLIPFFFSSFVINSVDKTVKKLVLEVRTQFKKKKKPDYETPIKITTRNAIKEMIISVLIIIVLVIIVGLILGIEALGSLIAGCVVSAFLLAIFMANAGGSMDNAKKHIEIDRYGTKAHKNSIIGDGVGDPLKDAAGPSLNILIKLIAIISLLLVLI
jgi:K(+)-stimulated pyrophosphate-energized sodium pump